MTREPIAYRETRTSDLGGAAFYYAHGLAFKGIETRPLEDKGGAFDMGLVFSGGPELETLNDAFYAGKGEVTVEQVAAFVAVLHRRLRDYCREGRVPKAALP